ncbi:MAG: tripartite tricarboxylate transporter substrate binding protein [Betaproteobacteria bacterium]|nr:tripartite tricarboxylate transporter substrate binding protein [Betaproteobacteria bacterium]
MKARMRSLAACAAAAFSVLVLPAIAAGQTFPTKPVRFLIPFPPGAGPDVLARTIGPQLTARWGQQLVVDNRPGGGGNIGVELGVRAAPDGYTLLLASNHVTINPSLFRKVPYDPVRDFRGVTLAAVIPNILVVHPSLPVKSVKDLVALAKSRPGQINFSSGGNGSVGHLAAEMFKTATRVQMTHIPYKGPVAAITALLNGEASLGFLVAPAALPHVNAGRLRALAVTGSKRSPAVSKLPTVAEAGVAGYEIVAWQGLFAPAGTPDDIVRKVHSDMIAVLGMPDIKQALLVQGLEAIGSTPEEFSEYIRNDLVKWARVVREANVRVD